MERTDVTIERSGKSHFNYLSVDAMVTVIAFLDVERVMSFGSTCQWAYHLCSGAYSRALWIPLLERMTLGVFRVGNMSSLEDLRQEAGSLQVAVRRRRLREHLRSMDIAANGGATTSDATESVISMLDDNTSVLFTAATSATAGATVTAPPAVTVSSSRPILHASGATASARDGERSHHRVTFSGLAPDESSDASTTSDVSDSLLRSTQPSMPGGDEGRCTVGQLVVVQQLLIDARLAEGFVEHLADHVMKFCSLPSTEIQHNLPNGDDPLQWRKRLACRLFAAGFERFSSQVRALHHVLRSHAGDGSKAPVHHLHVTTHKQVRVVEYFLSLLRYQSTFLTTQISDIEAVQEVCSTFASSPVINAGLELLKYVHKYFGRLGALLYDECVCISDALTASAFLSEISDHPNAQAKYQSVWVAYRGTHTLRTQAAAATTAAEEHQFQQDAFFMVPLAPETHGCLSITQQHRLRNIQTVLVADLVGYLLRIPKRERKSLLENIQSIYRLTVGEAATLLNNGR